MLQLNYIKCSLLFKFVKIELQFLELRTTLNPVVSIFSTDKSNFVSNIKFE